MILVLKRIIAMILFVLQCLFLNVSYGEQTAKPEKNPSKSEIINDIDGDTVLADSIKYAATVANKVNCYYTDETRSAYAMENSQMKLTHTLSALGNSATIEDKDGNIYIEDAFEAYYIGSDGVKFSSVRSFEEGRVNAIRLGKYYYECHVRDLDFMSTRFKVDKAYHVYADRIYNQTTLYANEATTKLSEFGTQIKIPKKTVNALQIKDANGVHSELDGYDKTSVEYVAFDIKSAGVVGFIIPSDGSTKSVEVFESGCNYVVRQKANYESGTGINKYDETGGYELNFVTLGCRIWTDSTHSFKNIDEAARLERNPLEGITVNGGNAQGKFLGYDALKGSYTFEMDGIDFNMAYANPDLQFALPVSITCDGYDRDIFIRSNGKNGCLESAAILDDTDTLVPIDVQVCKNFMGDGGEPYYSVKDYQYGDSYFPLSLKANETVDFTLLNLYQNWGKYPLKQISSIEFYNSYFHLSTGVTESNCIAPYFSTGRDGWLLPDFRTASGIIWSSQPQFNSEGILKFMAYRKRFLGTQTKELYSEFAGCRIDSVGQTYSDITSEYISDCGSYSYTLRHVEFPQKDENRTYYTLDVTFNGEVTFDNFKRDFDLFYFDGRFVEFDKIGYLNANNSPVTADVETSKKDVYYNLGTDSPYWGFYDITDDTRYQIDEHFGCNFALIIKDSDIVIGGKKSDIGFVMRDSSTKDLTCGALTLDAEKITFKPGDSIKINMILLPWGIGTEDNDKNVRAVREDSGLKPIKVTAKVGTVEKDAFVPTVRCNSNTAEFTLSGGRNNNAVRVNGFTSLECPDVYIKMTNGWDKIDLASSNGYDGYAVFYNDDGTYGFSFVYNAKSPAEEYTFKVVGG